MLCHPSGASLNVRGVLFVHANAGDGEEFGKLPEVTVLVLLNIGENVVHIAYSI
jgi:hypothetical protein